MAQKITKWLEKYWFIASGLLLFGLYLYGYQKMYFHQDDLDWFLMAQRPFWQVINFPIGDHVNYLFRLLIKFEWEVFHFNFPSYLMVSTLMHAVVVWLLYDLASQTSKRKDLAAIVALIFTINTNWTEAILWTSGQTISITAIFVLLAMQAMWKQKFQAVALFLASWTSALAIGLIGATAIVFEKMRVKAILVGLILGLIYFWKGTDGTAIEYGTKWLFNVFVVWGLAIINTVIGRLFIPFDRFEILRICLVCLMVILAVWKWRFKLKEIWNDTLTRFLLLQIVLYYLIVAAGRAQYGIGIMRAERYAYLGLVLCLLLMVRILRKVKIGNWIWILPVIILIQSIGLYRRAEDYIVRPQQLKILVNEIRKSGISEEKYEEYLPHFVLNDERLKYRDLMILLND
ncbi:MAG: hypothetical protein WCG44_01890 [bacterium]